MVNGFNGLTYLVDVRVWRLCLNAHRNFYETREEGVIETLHLDEGQRGFGAVMLGETSLSPPGGYSKMVMTKVR